MGTAKCPVCETLHDVAGQVRLTQKANNAEARADHIETIECENTGCMVGEFKIIR